MKAVPAHQVKAENPLIDAYFEMVASDDYRRFSELITDDCTFSLMPIGHTFRGRQEVMRFVTLTGDTRKHDRRSGITIQNWFTDGEFFCVEYQHSSILKLLKKRITIDGYCIIFHMRDGKFDAVREYINPSHLGVSFLTTCLLRVLPLVSKARASRTA